MKVGREEKGREGRKGEGGREIDTRDKGRSE